jgi:hypothetical protein
MDIKRMQKNLWPIKRLFAAYVCANIFNISYSKTPIKTSKYKEIFKKLLLGY